MTTIRHVTEHELREERSAILDGLGLTGPEFADLVECGALAGRQWQVFSDIQTIDYLLGEKTVPDC